MFESNFLGEIPNSWKIQHLFISFHPHSFQSLTVPPSLKTGTCSWSLPRLSSDLLSLSSIFGSWPRQNVGLNSPIMVICNWIYYSIYIYNVYIYIYYVYIYIYYVYIYTYYVCMTCVYTYVYVYICIYIFLFVDVDICNNIYIYIYYIMYVL